VQTEQLTPVTIRCLLLTLLSVGGLASDVDSLDAAKPGCMGLLAFSRLAPDAYSKVYSISLDGGRTDVSRTARSNGSLQLSPDGSKIAFWTEGRLVVADADGSDPRQIPGSSDDASTTVAWSPDSRRLALTLDAHSRVTTGTFVAIFDIGSWLWTPLTGLGATRPQWSPDGTTIAYDTSMTEVLAQRLDGTKATSIAPGTLMSWAPDGTHLLIANAAGQAQVVPATGGDPVVIPDLTGISWTPDGSRLIGITTNAPDFNALETVAIDGSDRRVVAENAGPARLSPDGHRVVFLRRSDGHVVVTDLEGRVLRDFGPWNGGPYDLHTQFAPSWSPNGAKIIYWSGGKVIVADNVTGTVRTLAGGAGETVGHEPVWSADGSAVFDDIVEATGNTDIYVAGSDGSGLRRVLADPVPDGGPAWSPDGKRLTFIRYGSRPSLVVADLAGHARTLTKLSRGDSVPRTSWDGDVPRPSPPAWSPDGKTIAVASRRGMKLVDVRSRTVRPWHRPAGEAVPVAVAWSRQGAIATTDGRDESSIWITRMGRTRTIGVEGFYDPNYGDVAGVAGNLAWSPDGSKLAYLRYGAENGTGFFAWAWDSIRITDTHTLKTRSIPADTWGFGWSPDGRYLVEGGRSTVIARPDGHRVATLPGLRAIDPSWQPLCKVMP
jgi:TolB protein